MDTSPHPPADTEHSYRSYRFPRFERSWPTIFFPQFEQWIRPASTYLRAPRCGRPFLSVGVFASFTVGPVPTTRRLQSQGMFSSSVVEGVRRIRESPFIADDIPASGFVYDVRTGWLKEVVGPTGGPAA